MKNITIGLILILIAACATASVSEERVELDTSLLDIIPEQAAVRTIEQYGEYHYVRATSIYDYNTTICKPSFGKIVSHRILWDEPEVEYTPDAENSFIEFRGVLMQAQTEPIATFSYDELEYALWYEENYGGLNVHLKLQGAAMGKSWNNASVGCRLALLGHDTLKATPETDFDYRILIQTVTALESLGVKRVR